MNRLLLLAALIFSGFLVPLVSAQTVINFDHQGEGLGLTQGDVYASLGGVFRTDEIPDVGSGGETFTFDLYRHGIHHAELAISPGELTTTATTRFKDVTTNSWSEEASAPLDSISSQAGFERFARTAFILMHVREFSSISWDAVHTLVWPGEAQMYRRHKVVRDTVSGQPVHATYWAEEDASAPLDLIIDDENNLLAIIDVSRGETVVRRGFQGLTPLKQWVQANISRAQYGVKFHGKYMVSVEGGAGLATLVYVPDTDERKSFPTILIRTPYGISGTIDRYWHYVARGYAVVLQAVQGTIYWDLENRSEGKWTAMVQEPQDGADALDWITAQPWSNGDVCMEGGSYVGYTQWTATMSSNPALKCVIPEVSMGTAFSDQPYMGGTLVQGLAFYIFFMLDQPILPGRSWTEILAHRPLAEIDEYATGKDIPLWNAFIDHWRNDAYWQEQNWYASDEPRNFGSLQISGWFDDDLPGTRSNWALMQEKGIPPQRLMIGPWKHGYNVDRELNGFSFGADALRADIWLIKQKWYDYFLKGIETDVLSPVVEYFVLGENKWSSTSAWPPPEAQDESWYFRSSGRAHQLSIDGRLSVDQPDGPESPDIYEYDPANPVRNWPSFDLMESWQDVQSFPYDFKDIEGRPDVVTYTSGVLEEDLTIAGNIKIILYASTDVLDTDWWVHLSDVYPDNQSVRLTVGALRARFRNLEDPTYHVFGSNFEREELLSGNPTDVVRYEISIPPIANTFKRGHRIRVAVMNALDNYSFPNSNTGGEEGYVTETKVGRMVIHHSPEYPSHIILPVISGRD